MCSFDQAREDDYHWFLDNYNTLFQKYGTSYLAIQNKTILGVYSNFGEAVNKTSEIKPLGTFIVQFCNGDESGYTSFA